MLVNKTKERLKAGEIVVGTAVGYTAPRLVEWLGYAGLHYVLIDCEHGCMTTETVEHMIRAAETAGITPVVRPVRNEGPTILQYLDMGAQGIYVPNIETKADAERAVRYSKYAPEGGRGLASYARWARGGQGKPLSELMKMANDNILVIALVESVKGVENIDEICSVPGIDVVTVGPFDLSQSMGIPGQLSHPDLVAAQAHVAARAAAHGKIASGRLSKPEDIADAKAKRILWQGVMLQTVVIDGIRNQVKHLL